MSAGFDERLLCQNLLDRIPCFRWDVLQMVIYIYTNKITQPHAGADKRRKTASVFTAVQLHIVCFPGRQRITLADNRTGFIGDLPLPNCLLKKRIGKTERSVMRRNMKSIVQYQKWTFQQRASINRQCFQIVLCKKLCQKYICTIALLPFIFHRLSSFACAESTSGFFFIILPVRCCFK